MMYRLIRLMIEAFALYKMCQFLWPQVYLANLETAFVLAVVIAVLYKLVYPVLKFFAFPLTFVTLGFFKIILNCFIFYLAAILMGERYFMVNSIFYGSLLAAVYGLVQLLFFRLFPPKDWEDR